MRDGAVFCARAGVDDANDANDVKAPREEARTLIFAVCLRQDNEEHVYSTLKSKNTTARVLGLKPGTKYIFQVRARTSAGCGRFSQNVEIQTGKAG